MSDLSLSVNKTINAPIETVFDAWLDAGQLAKFMQPMSGMPKPETQTDAVVGGRFEIVMQVGEQKQPHSGEYLEISRPHKLMFSWQSASSPDDSVVTLNFTAEDEGTTQVELTHVKFLNEQMRDNHQGGWGNILSELDALLS